MHHWVVSPVQHLTGPIVYCFFGSGSARADLAGEEVVAWILEIAAPVSTFSFESMLVHVAEKQGAIPL